MNIMDTSDTSDFESADEFFSESEESTGNDSKREIISNDIVGTKSGKCKSEIALHREQGTILPVVPPSIEQCWEPGMDYSSNVEKVSIYDSTIRNTSRNSKEIIEIDKKEPTFQHDENIPIIQNPLQCRESVVDKRPNEDELSKVDESKKIEQTDPEPFDEDENPIPDIQKPTQCWEPGMNYVVDESKDSEIGDLSNDIQQIDINQVVAENNAEEESKEVHQPIPLVPRVRPVCWFPKLNEANRLRQEAETATKGSNLELEDKGTETKVVNACNNANINKVLVEANENASKESTTSKSDSKLILENKLDEVKEDDNMWDKDDLWEEQEEISSKTTAKSSENILEEISDVEVDENLWKDDLWGDEYDWNKKEEGSSDTAQLVKPNNTSDRVAHEEEEENMWENDQWESVDKDEEFKVPKTPEVKNMGGAFDNLTEDSRWSSWGNWGISSVLNTMSQGLTTVIGVPDPEDLARQHNAQRELEPSQSADSITKEVNETDSFVGLGSLVSGVTKLVETTGTKVISGGLGTLETIGKKTMEVLQENDPGLKKKRAFLKKIEPEKTVLSQILREAKEKSESSGNTPEVTKREKAVDYEFLFDDYQGLVHLEALEMLSRQCTIKLQTVTANLSGPVLVDLQETLDQVKELCELPPEEDEHPHITVDEFSEATLTAIGDLNVPISFTALIGTWQDLDVTQLSGMKDLHRRGVETLAQFTAMAVEQFHRGGEFLLVKEHRSTVDEADSLVQLTSTIISMLNTVTAVFTERFNDLSEEMNEDVNEFITNIFFESANSTKYIRSAFELLIPVLQVGAT